MTLPDEPSAKSPVKRYISLIRASLTTLGRVQGLA